MVERAIPKRRRQPREWRRAGSRTAFVALLGSGAACTVAALMIFAWPSAESVSKPTLFTIDADDVPAPGDDPLRVAEGRFWLINLAPDDGEVGEFGVPTAGGLLALSWRDSHKGCSITWKADLVFETRSGVSRKGWFRDPCSGSVYMRGGVQVWGPSPRSMDTYALDVRYDGVAVVRWDVLVAGADDNPAHAVPYESD